MHPDLRRPRPLPGGRSAAGLEATAMRDHVTFREILAKTADASSRRLVERARTASSVAKVATGLGSKRRAYAVKHAALEHGVERFRAEFALSGIEEDGRLVRVRWRHEACLHLPVDGCGENSRQWLREERARISAEWRGMAKAA